VGNGVISQSEIIICHFRSAAFRELGGGDLTLSSLCHQLFMHSNSWAF